MCRCLVLQRLTCRRAAASTYRGTRTAILPQGLPRIDYFGLHGDFAMRAISESFGAAVYSQTHINGDAEAIAAWIDSPGVSLRPKLMARSIACASTYTECW